MSIVNDDCEAIRLPDIGESQKEKICDFVQGAVYCWCKNRKKDRFHFRDLVSSDWTGTPLQAIRDYRRNYGSDDPSDSAGKDAGWFLKKVLREDDRQFESFDGEQAKCYEWIG